LDTGGTVFERDARCGETGFRDELGSNR